MLFADVFPSLGDSVYTIIVLLAAQVAQWLYTRYQSHKLKMAIKEKEVIDKKARRLLAKRQARLNRTAKESLQVNQKNHELNASISGSVNEMKTEMKHSLNGEGLGGQMRILLNSLTDIVAWQDAHEQNDLARHRELTDKIDANTQQVMLQRHKAEETPASCTRNQEGE